MKARYNAYHYNLNISICVILAILFIIGHMVGFFSTNELAQGIGLLMFIFAIMLHVQNHKLRIKSTASILIYVCQVLGLTSAVIMLMLLTRQSDNLLIALGLLNILSLLLQIIAAILAFLAARKLKKKHPNLIQDYIQLKKSKREIKNKKEK